MRVCVCGWRGWLGELFCVITHTGHITGIERAMLPSLSVLSLHREVPTGGRQHEQRLEKDMINRLNLLYDTDSTNPDQVEHKTVLLTYFDKIQAMIESPHATTQEAGLYLLSQWYSDGFGLLNADKPIGVNDSSFQGSKVLWTRNLLWDRGMFAKIAQKLEHPAVEDPSDSHGDLQCQAVLLVRKMVRDIPSAWALARSGVVPRLLDMLSHARESPTSKEQKINAAVLLGIMVNDEWRYVSHSATLNIVPENDIRYNQPMSQNAWIMHGNNGIPTLLKHLRSDERYSSGQASAAKALAGIASWARPYDAAETLPSLPRLLKTLGAFDTIGVVLRTPGNSESMTKTRLCCVRLLAKLCWGIYYDDEEDTLVDELQQHNILQWLVQRIYTNPTTPAAKSATEVLSAMCYGLSTRENSEVSALPGKTDLSHLIRTLPITQETNMTGTEKLIDVFKREDDGPVPEHKLKLAELFQKICENDAVFTDEFLNNGGFAWALRRLTSSGDSDPQKRLKRLVDHLVHDYDYLRNYAVDIGRWAFEVNPNICWQLLNQFAPREPPPHPVDDDDVPKDFVAEGKGMEDAFTAFCGHGMVWDHLAEEYAKVKLLPGPHKRGVAFRPLRVGTAPGTSEPINPSVDGWNWDHVAYKMRNMTALADAAAANPHPSVQAAFMYMLRLQAEAEDDTKYAEEDTESKELKVAYDQLLKAQGNLKSKALTGSGEQSEADRQLIAELKEKQEAYAEAEEAFYSSGGSEEVKMRLLRRETHLHTLEVIEKVHRENLLWGPVLEREITTTRESLTFPRPGNPIYEEDRRRALWAMPFPKKQRTTAAFLRVFDLSQEHAR